MTTQDKIAKLSSLIDLERELQQNAVRWALTRLVGARQCGVVLADEVGCGKTYEALVLLALLWYHYQGTPNPIRRVLILCKSSLLRKWHEELTAKETQPKHGLRPYLTGSQWEPFVKQFIDRMVMIDNLTRAERMWLGKDEKSLRGVRTPGRIQVPEGLYLVNNQLLYESRRSKSKLLRYLYNTVWDLVIVDEAHHYGKGSKCDSIFATRYQGLGRGGRPDFGAESTLMYRHILLLTATPFELEPGEILNLLRITRAPEGDRESLSDLLGQYQRALNVFYGLRALPPDNPRRRAVVEQLRQLRLGQNGSDGLEAIMRRYIVRNRKGGIERHYALVNRSDPTWEMRPFDKFGDLKSLVARSPLIPFSGPDALFYLELRTLIQEVIEEKSGDEKARGTFVAMDLQQGLSSYPQLLPQLLTFSDEDEVEHRPELDGERSSRLLESDNERARRLRSLLSVWHANGRLHPKVRAVVDVVRAIVEREIHAVERGQQEWFAKVVIFSKLVAGTSPHLRQQLAVELEPLLREMLERLAYSSPFGNADALLQVVRELVRVEVSYEREQFTRRCQQRGESPILAKSDLRAAGFDIGSDMHAVEVLEPYFENRARQALFLIDFLLYSPRPRDEDALRRFLRERMIVGAVATLEEIIDKYLDTRPDEEEERRLGEALRDTGIRGLSLLRERLRSPQIVARYDGRTGRRRESNRINFNERWNPLVLIVSRVGEEGIDLQKQASYILHYDLEWNPAKMEQREGRVDREGYRQDYQDKDEPIDVRFFLLKGTYEERIFHTVMQRDQWFQILMGEQRCKLGQHQQEDEEKDSQTDGALLQDTVEAEYGIGGLTLSEKEAVMLDLQPTF